MKHRIARRAFVLAAAVVGFAAPAYAQGGYISAENLNYTGSLTCYNSLADAMGQTNATCNSLIPQRDLSIYFVNNNPLFAGLDPASSAIFMTNWYAGTGSNPNNTNYGFVQMYDNDAGSVTSMTTSWDPTLTIFEIAASGGPSIMGCTTMPTQDCGRLWNGANPSALANGGSFVTWNFNAMFSGFTAATYNPATGVYESASEPTSVTGSINGIFADGKTGMYYNIDATLSSGSWAADNGGYSPTIAGAAVTATPEPASLALVATGLGGLGGYMKRRRRAKQA